MVSTAEETARASGERQKAHHSVYLLHLGPPPAASRALVTRLGGSMQPSQQQLVVLLSIIPTEGRTEYLAVTGKVNSGQHAGSGRNGVISSA